MGTPCKEIVDGASSLRRKHPYSGISSAHDTTTHDKNCVEDKH